MSELLKKKILSLEEYDLYCSLSDYEKVLMRIRYERALNKSGRLNSFFENIAVIYLRLSLNQIERLRHSFGTISRNFFECIDFVGLLNAVASPLFNTTRNKMTVAEAQAAADDAQASAKALPTDESKAASHNAKVFAEYMAAKANVGKSAAAKAAFFKSMADKAKAAADKAQASADADATDESKAVAKSMYDKFRKAYVESQDAICKAEAIVKANTNAEQGNKEIMMYSNEFDGKSVLKKSFNASVVVDRYKVFTCKYNPNDLKLATAILEVFIFIFEVLLPRSVDDEERYKQSLREIGITDEKSVEKLASDRRRRDIELRKLSDNIKTFFRDGILNKLSDPPKPKAFHQEVFNSLIANESFMRFLRNTCDTCQQRVDHLGLWRTAVGCTECGGECPVFLEPTTAPAQASDSLQPLATEITTAKISFGEPAQKLANVLLKNGVCQLSELSDLEQSEFESIVQELQLNTLQVQKIRKASGRP